MTVWGSAPCIVLGRLIGDAAGSCNTTLHPSLLSPGDAPSARSHADALPASPASPASLQVRKEMQARVPVTPPESAEWLGRMMAEMWAPFVGPLVLKENLGAWQVGGSGREGGEKGRGGAALPPGNQRPPSNRPPPIFFSLRKRCPPRHPLAGASSWSTCLSEPMRQRRPTIG